MKRFSQSYVWLLSAFVMFLCCGGLSAAGDLEAPFVKSGDAPSVQEYFAEVKSDGLVFNQSGEKLDPVPSYDVRGQRNEDMIQGSRKSVQKAFLYSLIVPGAGQFYNGSKIKAILFLGLEAASWAGHLSYHNKGLDRTVEFELFADNHWAESSYGDYLEINWDVRDDDSIYKDGDETRFYFTHHLPDTKTQQYYEMIGKYDQFVFGWDDVDSLETPNPDAHKTTYSVNRNTYEDMRFEANKMYGRATTSLIVMMGNHLFSAMEAAWSAQRHNKKVDRFVDRVKIRAIMAQTNNEYFPMLTMTYKF